MSPAPIRLSVLDQSPVIYGHSARDAIAATVDLAQLTDALGYTRYWCAEHHGLRGVSNPAPEVMIARVASATKHLRVGSGGVMLPYYSPFKLAEQFRLLEALFPNRIDLGVGRAPGGDMRTAQAVAMGDYNRGDIFPQQVQELIWHLTGTLPPDHPAYGVILQPEIDTRPELWVLGSSDFGGALAARLGIRFAFAHFINPHVGHIVAQQYRTDFEPGYDARPYSAAAIFVIATDTEAEARRYEAAIDLRRVQMALGVNGPIPTVEQGEAHVYTERDQAIVMRERPRSIIGTPESVAEQMHALKERFVADELIVLTVAPSYKARLRSYELLAEAFALPSPASATSSASPA